MKRTKLALLAIWLFASIASTAQSKNPFKSIGKKSETLTLTKGQYEEFFDQDSIQQVGTVLINVRTGKVVKLLEEQEAKKRLENEKGSRFLSVDPLASRFPFYSPYQYASNDPITSIDFDGLEGLVATGMAQPFSNDSRPVGMIVTAQDAGKINRNIAIAAFKAAFSEPLPKKFIDHYANGNGTDYKLNKSEAISLNVAKTGIQGIVPNDKDKFDEMVSSARTTTRRGDKVLNSKQTTIDLDNYNIQGAANTGGTLGRFTIQIQGKLTINNDDKSWSFEGKMKYFDRFDFETSPGGNAGDLQRSDWGDFQTNFGKRFLPGTGFNVYSDWINVKQTSSDPYFDYFKDKSDEAKLNRPSKELKLSTEGGTNNDANKPVKETKHG